VVEGGGRGPDGEWPDAERQRDTAAAHPPEPLSSTEKKGNPPCLESLESLE